MAKRTPSILCSPYASSAASVVRRLRCASSTAARRSASETKGTRPASSTCAAVQLTVAQHLRTDERLAPRASTRSYQRKESQITKKPRPHRKYVSLSHNQLPSPSRTPEGGLPGCERAMSGSKSRFSKSAAVSALRAIIMISELR